jgi:hypothetical protein
LDRVISQEKSWEEKKTYKWNDFANETDRDGKDTAKNGYDKYKEATNPVQSKFLKKIGFGGDM